MIQKLLVVQCMVASSVVANPVVRTMAAQARDPVFNSDECCHFTILLL